MILPVQVINNVGIFVFPHDQDLIDDELLLRLLLQIHLLNGHLKAGEIKENHIKEPCVCVSHSPLGLSLAPSLLHFHSLLQSKSGLWISAFIWWNPTSIATEKHIVLHLHYSIFEVLLLPLVLWRCQLRCRLFQTPWVHKQREWLRVLKRYFVKVCHC